MIEVISLLTAGFWITTLLFLCLFSILLVFLERRRKFVCPLKNLPHPTALPIIGNAYQLNCSPEEFFKRTAKWAHEFGDIYLLWRGLRPYILLYRAETIQPLLNNNTHIDKSLEYGYLKPWLGSGLITSNGAKWHSRRKLLTPIFHNRLLDEYLKIAIKEATILISCLSQNVGKTFDVVLYAKRAALDIICQSAMGCRINAQTNFNNEYVTAAHNLASIIQQRFTNIWLSFDPIFKQTKRGKEHDRSLDIVNRFVDKVIADRKAYWKLHHDGISDASSTEKQTLLDLLLEMSQDGAVPTDKDIRDEVNTFMFAGHDTTSASISFMLYVLGRHPEYQKKILDECDNVIGTGEITLDNLNKLTWLNACIKEQWRLYTTVPLIARQICKPIEIIGTKIPPGSTVAICTYLLHHDARYFPEPHIYRPERFLPGRPELPSYSFIPFSAGSRNCIGWKFATIMVKVVVLSVLKAFHVEAMDREDQLRLKYDLVLTNADGIRLKMTPRDR